MANIRSSEKSIRQTKVRTAANRSKKSRIRTLRNKTTEAIKAGDASKVTASLSVTASALDKAAKTGTIHKNTASRIKSRLAKAANKAAAAAK
jgi:small subunit ribosomal protein S20